MDKAERTALIEKYGKAYDNFVAALSEIPKAVWHFKPAPKEWSVHEVIVHLADSETNSFLRARRLVAEPGQPLMAYDQDVWAIKLDYHQESTDDALQVTKWVRKMTYDMLKRLPDEVWNNTAVHPEYDEPYTFEKWLRIYSDHPNVHAGQIRDNYTAWKKQNMKAG
jgi:hypothetical protein